MNVKIDISSIINSAVESVNAQLPARAAAAGNCLRNAALDVLRGQRSGRVYKTPAGGRYTASAPGEPPAVRTGTLRTSWRPVRSGPNGINPAIETNVPYAWLDEGSPHGMIAPRPYSQKIIEKAAPEVFAIYGAPYTIK